MNHFLVTNMIRGTASGICLATSFWLVTEGIGLCSSAALSHLTTAVGFLLVPLYMSISHIREVETNRSTE